MNAALNAFIVALAHDLVVENMSLPISPAYAHMCVHSPTASMQSHAIKSITDRLPIKSWWRGPLPSAVTTSPAP